MLEIMIHQHVGSLPNVASLFINIFSYTVNCSLQDAVTLSALVSLRCCKEQRERERDGVHSPDNST